MRDILKLKLIFGFILILLSACDDDGEPTVEPIAAFSFNITNEGILPTTVNFTSTSQNAASYQWSFGDGGTSDLQNSEHTYTESGTFQVSLTVENGSLSDTETKSVIIAAEAETTSIPQVDDVINTFMATYNVPGLSVAITKGEALVYAKSYGMADTDNNIEVSNNSLFRIASVSKPITSVAIFKLIEEGKLSIDQKVFGDGSILGTDYGSTPYSSGITDITLSQLLHHTAGGWGNSANDPMFSNQEMSQAELISWVLDNRPLDYQPGVHYDYSNFGYCVLGRVIEKVTGETYETWVKENVLEPAGIYGMEIAGNTLEDQKENEVVYYGQSGQNPYIYNIVRMDAHGGWISNATDLARFLVHVDNYNSIPDILETSSINNMTTASSAYANYACGWGVNSANNWWHVGSLPGTATEIVRASNGYNWVVLCNTRSANSAFINELDGLIWKAVTDATTAWPNVDLF